jgi:primosomal protein N' (replication factor Y)
MLPFRDLGLIIVDEEHDPNFKQHENPRYNARDAAIWMAAQIGAKVILGSATPSVETWNNAKQGRYGLVELSERFGGAILPEIVISDLKELVKRKMMKSLFSPLLLEEIKKTIEEGRQVLLLQNRRGFSAGVECQSCGHIPQCVHCDVTLTYHRGSGQLRCHYCGYVAVVPIICSSCGETQIKTIGFGTEKVEDELAIYFPDYRIGRMDLDTTRSRSSYDRIFAAFAGGETQILVGTQMISKGLDFANVGLVGILNADAMLGFPDFRSFERGYQLMVQVSGRAGRRTLPGKVVIQTKKPDHPVIQWVISQDFQALMQYEFAERQQFSYPPFCRLINFSLRHPDPQKLGKAANDFANALRRSFGVRVLGPSIPPIPRIRNQYYQCMMLKVEKSASYQQAKIEIKRVIETFKASENRGVQVLVDVDA